MRWKRDEDGFPRTLSIFSVEATNAKGFRFQSAKTFRSQEDAEKLQTETRKQGDNFDPQSQGWIEGPPVYGSEAWTDEDEWEMETIDRRAEEQMAYRW